MGHRNPYRIQDILWVQRADLTTTCTAQLVVQVLYDKGITFLVMNVSVRAYNKPTIEFVSTMVVQQG